MTAEQIKEMKFVHIEGHTYELPGYIDSIEIKPSLTPYGLVTHMYAHGFNKGRREGVDLGQQLKSEEIKRVLGIKNVETV